MCSSCAPVDYRDHVAPGSQDLGGGDVASVAGRLPGEAGAGVAVCLGELSSSGETADAVLEHGARGCRPDGGEGRKHEDVGVPEDMPLIGAPREAAGSHRCLAIGGCRGEQVEHGEARRQLILRDVVVIPLDHDLRVLPHLGPGASVLGQECVKAESFCLLEVLAEPVGNLSTPAGGAAHAASRSTTS